MTGRSVVAGREMRADAVHGGADGYDAQNYVLHQAAAEASAGIRAGRSR